MLRALLFLACLILPAAASAEEVVAGLSQNRVAITANFDGSEILIFGAVKRETAINEQAPLNVIVTVAGPSAPVAVRKKERKAGIWVNTRAVEVDSAPAFYAVATSAPFDEALSETADLRHKITIDHVIRSVGAPADIPRAAEYTEALIRIRTNNDHYLTLEDSVDFSDQTLFSTRIALPSSLVEGNYATRIFLTRDGNVVNEYQTVIDVRKVGLERFLYNLAHEQALLYGLMSLAIAIAAGWSASAVFRYLQGQG